MAASLTAKGEATRARIVEGAAALVREHGVEHTGLDDIRARTATSKSQLFHYFPEGRAQLMRAVAEHEAAQVLLDQEPELSELGPAESWQAWRDTVVRKYEEQGVHCPLSALTSQLGPSDPGIRPIVADLLGEWHRSLAVGVARTSPDADADAVASSLLASVQGGVTLLLATGDSTHLKVALDAAIRSAGLDLRA
jgi:AcrR family transcriptional regulator